MQEKTELPVALSMRYGDPSMKTGLQELHDKGVTDVLIIPLYPQHAMATTDTILVLAEQLRKEFFPQMTFTDIPAFYHKKEYIKVLAESIKTSLEGKEWDKILFSYHGIPERHVRKSDITKSHCKPNDSVNFECCKTASPAHEFCYKHQCYETTRQVVEYLGIEPHQYFVSFQSRLAGDPWLQPYTDKMLEKYPNEGVKNLAVVTPAFVSDCLETLEEIAMEGKEEFLKAGGEKFYAIPCINDSDDWVDVLVNWMEA